MKKVKLTETSFNKLKNKLLNEVTYGYVNRAYDWSDKLYDELIYAHQQFEYALSDAIFEYDSVANKNVRDENEKKVNPYLSKIKAYSDAIGVLLSAKEEQRDKFSDETKDIDVEKFYKDKNRPEEFEDIDDVDLNTLKKDYSK